MDHITSALIHASRTGDLPLLQEIIELNTKLEVRDDKGYTPLIIACYNHQIEAARLLLQSGADVNGTELLDSTPDAFAKTIAQHRFWQREKKDKVPA